MANVRPEHEAFENLTRKHAVVCVPPEGVLTEDVVLAVGDVIGCEHVRAASRMSQKVIVFVSDEDLVQNIVSTGLTTESDVFMLASPMDTPAMKIVI